MKTTFQIEACGRDVQVEVIADDTHLMSLFLSTEELESLGAAISAYLQDRSAPLLRTQWNTGLKYTPHGQRIVAEQERDLMVRFADIDRQIFGKLYCNYRLRDEAELRAFVEKGYATMKYHQSTAGDSPRWSECEEISRSEGTF